jgi:hypothetical protein
MTTSVAQHNAQRLAALKELFGSSGNNSDLSAGVSGGFPVLSFRGKVWRLISGGEERPILNSDGDPVSSLVVVLLRAQREISKLYYAKRYQEGDDARPDCFSVDGVKPDPRSPHKQAESCVSCPHNVFGSRITESGAKGKACSDNRRLAVVPLASLTDQNAIPTLLRVPPASLGELAKLGRQLDKAGVPYQGVAVKLGFDPNVAYPKLVFSVVRVLTIEEGQAVLDLLNHEVMESIFEAPPDIDLPAKSAPASVPAPAPAPAASDDAPRRPRGRPPKSASAPVQPSPEVDDSEPATVEQNVVELDDELLEALKNF